MRKWADIMKNISLLTQFGLSFVTPLLLCLVLCWWLTTNFEVGEWIYIPGFFFGMGGSGMVAYKFYLSVMNRHKKQDRKKRISFNRHL
jgi:hypothetical protein